LLEVPAAIALLRAELAGGRGDAEGLAGFAISALAHMREEERGPRLWARYLLACAEWMRGGLGRAEAGFAEVLAEASSTPEAHPRMTACYTLGRVQRERGELDAALRTYREGLALAAQGGRALALHAGEATRGDGAAAVRAQSTGPGAPARRRGRPRVPAKQLPTGTAKECGLSGV